MHKNTILVRTRPPMNKTFGGIIKGLIGNGTISGFLDITELSSNSFYKMLNGKYATGPRKVVLEKLLAYIDENLGGDPALKGKLLDAAGYVELFEVKTKGSSVETNTEITSEKVPEKRVNACCDMQENKTEETGPATVVSVKISESTDVSNTSSSQDKPSLFVSKVNLKTMLLNKIQSTLFTKGYLIRKFPLEGTNFNGIFDFGVKTDAFGREIPWVFAIYDEKNEDTAQKQLFQILCEFVLKDADKELCFVRIPDADEKASKRKISVVFTNREQYDYCAKQLSMISSNGSYFSIILCDTNRDIILQEFTIPCRNIYAETECHGKKFFDNKTCYSYLFSESTKESVLI